MGQYSHHTDTYRCTRGPLNFLGSGQEPKGVWQREDWQKTICGTVIGPVIVSTQHSSDGPIYLPCI